MDPNATSTPSSTGGYPVNFLQHQQQQHQQPSPYGQQFPFAPGVVPSFPQPKTPSQPPSFGAVPFSQSGASPGGAIMPTAGFPQHSSAGPHATFTAPFAQPPVPSTMNHFLPPQATSTPTPTLPITAAQPFSQNMASIQGNSMVGVPPQQQPRPVQQPQPRPAQPQQAQGQTQQQQQSQPTPGQGTPQTTPQSGHAADREKARVTVLLEINSMLLQEVMSLQAAGKAGAPPQQQQQPGSQESNPSPGSDQGSEGGPKGPAQKPSPEYIECMRRLQANLAYLATIADRAKKSGGVPPPAPAIMTPPPNTPSMGEVYNRLNELFPRPGKGSIGTPQPSPQSSQGNGKPSPSPAAESVV